jgi:hypothetical protein
MSLCEQAIGYPDFLLFSKGPVSYILTQWFLNGMLILNASLLNHRKYYTLGKEADSKKKKNVH